MWQGQRDEEEREKLGGQDLHGPLGNWGPVAESHTGDSRDLREAGRKTGACVRKVLCSVVR